MSDTVNLGSNPDIRKPIVFKLIKKRTSSATEGRYYPGLKRIPSEDFIFDPEKKVTKAIRYSISEESIYRDEQPSHVELTDIIFTNGSLRVYEDNPTLLNFLRSCNYNRDNKNRVKGKTALFYEYNPQKIAVEMLEAENLEVDARYKASHMKFSELKGVARALKVNTDRSAEEIRHDMMQIAKRSPRTFLDALDNPVMQRKVEILEAVELGILSIEQRGVFMETATGNKEQVFIVPVGQDATDTFAEWTLTDKEGEAVYKSVRDKRKKMLD
jgi:hypothetical protein